MTRFFVGLQNGTALIADHTGSELDTFKEARKEVIGAMQEYASNELPDGEHRQFTVNISNLDGQAIYRARLALEGERLDT